jgi:hypothetical protein
MAARCLGCVLKLSDVKLHVTVERFVNVAGDFEMLRMNIVCEPSVNFTPVLKGKQKQSVDALLCAGRSRC